MLKLIFHLDCPRARPVALSGCIQQCCTYMKSLLSALFTSSSGMMSPLFPLPGSVLSSLLGPLPGNPKSLTCFCLSVQPLFTGNFINQKATGGRIPQSYMWDSVNRLWRNLISTRIQTATTNFTKWSHIWNRTRGFLGGIRRWEGWNSTIISRFFKEL